MHAHSSSRIRWKRSTFPLVCVGEDPLTRDPEAVEPRRCPEPERRSRDGLFVVEDLGVHDSGSVIERAVDVAITAAAVAEEVTFVAFASHTPAASVVGRPVTTIQSRAALSAQDALSRVTDRGGSRTKTP